MRDKTHLIKPSMTTLNSEKTHIVGPNFCLPLEGLKLWCTQTNCDLLGDNIANSIKFIYQDREIVVANCSINDQIGKQILSVLMEKRSTDIDNYRMIKNCAVGSFVGSGCALATFVLFTIWYHRSC